MTDIKTPRSAQTRAKEERRKPWQPPSQLDAPPCPDGYKQRWLRHRVNGADDNKNITAKLREGWELVRADQYSENMYSAYNGNIKAYEGVISVGDLLLARIPEEIVNERNSYYKNRTEQQTEAWEKDPLRDQHPSMPINADRQSRVSFGGGNKKPS
jgi:hypothetical protein|tara:strand:+ start:207 stop:674 length:468 start_codon:yes stop_codon:yes gene_type:complete